MIDFASPFDREHHEEGDVPGLAARILVSPAWRRVADLCFILVKAAAYLAAIYLAVLGLPLLAFLVASGGDMALLFAQLGNLSAHYLAAPAASQAMFAGEIKLTLAAIATFAAIWRLPRFLDEVAATLDKDDEQ